LELPFRKNCAEDFGPIFDNFATASLTAYVFGTKDDIGNRVSALATALSQNDKNFGPLTAKNRIFIFTHPPKILRFRNLTANLTAYIFRTNET